MKTIAAVRRTTARKDLLDIMLESGLWTGRPAARAALGAVCAAVRAWLIAMSSNPPRSVMSRLTLPGVGSIRIAWYAYRSYSPRVVVRFRPTPAVRRNLERVNKASYAEHCQNGKI